MNIRSIEINKKREEKKTKYKWKEKVCYKQNNDEGKEEGDGIEKLAYEEKKKIIANNYESFRMNLESIRLEKTMIKLGTMMMMI